MISYVLLRNWRGYEKVALEPEEGVTFVVAENGTGKTSLLQGVSWTLFGKLTGLDVTEALRRGTTELSGEVACDVDGQPLVVTRQWMSDGRGHERLTLDSAGDLDSGNQLNLLLARTGVSVDVLSRLWFVPELRLVEEGELFTDIGNHLRHLLGIDRLEDAATRVEKVMKGVGQRASRLKKSDRLQAEERRSLETQLSGAEREIAALEDALEDASARQQVLAAELNGTAAWDRYQTQREQYLANQGEFSLRAAELAIDGEPQAALDELQNERQGLDRSIAAAVAETDLIASVSEQLGDAGGTCPVCLQPISPDQASTAAQTHAHRIDQLRTERAQLEEELERVRLRARDISALASELSRLIPPEPPTGARGRSADLVEQDLARVTDITEQSNRRHGELSAAVRQLRASLAEDDQTARAEREVRRLYSIEAAARVVAEAARATAADRVEQAQKPLTSAITEQWQRFFPARGALAMTGRGGVAVRRAEGEVKYSQLSGGERVLTSLLTRLLFVASSTALDSIWMDEPLEHLDPINRVRAAHLLVEAARPGNRLKQVVVTTYEEGLARMLASRHEHVHVVYVSPEGLS